MHSFTMHIDSYIVLVEPCESSCLFCFQNMHTRQVCKQIGPEMTSQEEAKQWAHQCVACLED